MLYKTNESKVIMMEPNSDYKYKYKIAIKIKSNETQYYFSFFNTRADIYMLANGQIYRIKWVDAIVLLSTESTAFLFLRHFYAFLCSVLFQQI